MTLEFADEHKRVLLDQMPQQNETLEAIKENMPTEAIVQMQTEQKMKAVTTHLQKLVGEILASCI